MLWASGNRDKALWVCVVEQNHWPHEPGSKNEEEEIGAPQFPLKASPQWPKYLLLLEKSLE
jgi:hypothetical protein